MNLHAFDLSAGDDGKQMERLWTVEASPALFLPQIESMAVAGDTVYVVGNVPAGAYIPARLAVPAPEPLSGEAGPSASPLAALSEDVLFVAEGAALEIYDLSRPGEMERVGVYQPPATSISALDMGQTAGGESLYLYAGSPFDAEPEELFTFRLPDLEPLGHLEIEPAETETSVRQGALFDLALSGNRAYAVTGDGLYQLDVANPAAPQVTASHPFIEDVFDPRGLVVLDSAVYLGKELGNRVQVAAFAFEGGAPRQIAKLDDLRGGDLQALEAAGDRLYVTTSSSAEEGWLHTIEANEGNMERLSSLRLPAAPGRALATNGMLVAAKIGDQLFLIDASTAEDPAVIATVPLPIVHDLAFWGDLLLATAGDRLLAFDVSDPANPRAAGAFILPTRTPFAGAEVAVSGETIVVGNGAMGVWLLSPAAAEAGELQN